MTVWEGLNPPYRTIVADPPWAYNTTRQLTTAKTKKPDAEANYSTLTMREIAALPVGDLADKDAHLYVWVTNPRLFGDDSGDARFGPIDIIEAWGFEYRTMLTWHKTGILGLGYYFRGDTEHVLFATRGSAPIPPADRERNWFDAPRCGHSVKPAVLGDLVERVSPGPYVELFARQPRLGWDSWGYGYESGVAHRRSRQGGAPMKYRKKPVVIEAWQVAALLACTADQLPRPIQEAQEASIDSVPTFGFGDGVIFVQTLEGTMKAEADDWIIRGVAGEFYPCKPDIFAATYEPVLDKGEPDG